MNKHQKIHQTTLLLILLMVSINPPTQLGTAHTEVLITHNFDPMFSPVSTDDPSPRGIVIGKFHPDGIVRAMTGSSQIFDESYNGGYSITYKGSAVDPFDFTFESRDVHANEDDFDIFTPHLAYDFDDDGVVEVLGKLFTVTGGHKAIILGWDGLGYSAKLETVASRIWVGQSAIVSDVDLDGYPELITTNSANKTTFIYSWDGDPAIISFCPSPSISTITIEE